MIRNDLYTVYKGKEYRIGKYTKETVNLISTDAVDEQDGFEHFSSNPNLYRKTISISEIGDVYDISPYAIYKGYRFGINGENETEYYLGTGDTALANSLGFEMVDREVYRKWIPKKDMEKVYEEKRLKANLFDVLI